MKGCVIPYDKIYRISRLVFQDRVFADTEAEVAFRRQHRVSPVNNAFFDPKDRFVPVTLNAPPEIPHPPEAPTNVSLAAGDSELTLSWTDAVNSDSHTIYYSTFSGVNKNNGTAITGVTSPYIHTGRTNGVTYYYVVVGVNEDGEGDESAEVSGTPLAAPTNVQAEAGVEENILSWTNGIGATSHNLYYDLNPGVTKITGSKIASVVSPYVHSGLITNQPYHYVLTGENAGGETIESVEVTATPINFPENHNQLIAMMQFSIAPIAFWEFSGPGPTFVDTVAGRVLSVTGTDAGLETFQSVSAALNGRKCLHIPQNYDARWTTGDASFFVSNGNSFSWLLIYELITDIVDSGATTYYIMNAGTQWYYLLNGSNLDRHAFALLDGGNDSEFTPLTAGANNPIVACGQANRLANNAQLFTNQGNSPGQPINATMLTSPYTAPWGIGEGISGINPPEIKLAACALFADAGGEQNFNAGRANLSAIVGY